jgi:FK506-binding protein 2
MYLSLSKNRKRSFCVLSMSKAIPTAINNSIIMKILAALVLYCIITTASAFGLCRRNFFHIAGATATSSLIPQNVNGIMTDETTFYATPSLGSTYTQQSPEGSISFANSFAAAPTRAPSDEITFTITKSELQNMKGGFGLELGEVAFRTNFRVVVKSVAPNSLAATAGIQPGWIAVSIDGADCERTDASGVATYFSRAVKSVLNQPDGSGKATMTLTFRDPSVFRSELQNLSNDGQAVSTKIAPAGDTTQRFADGSLRPGASVTEQNDQVITVSQLIPPKMCNRRATTDDLVEISYIGQVLDTGAIFDGSAVKINGQDVPGRGNDVSVYFVLGKQPFGQFPPGWDVGIEGMCVGERRRLIIPPVLAYGSTGVPRRGIPPDATLQYDVTLVSLNGLATPQ